ncbi:putative holin-like toxin [Melghiribacillus thermohalophilus]
MKMELLLLLFAFGTFLLHLIKLIIDITKK